MPFCELFQTLRCLFKFKFKQFFYDCSLSCWYCGVFVIVARQGNWTFCFPCLPDVCGVGQFVAVRVCFCQCDRLNYGRICVKGHHCFKTSRRALQPLETMRLLWCLSRHWLQSKQLYVSVYLSS